MGRIAPNLVLLLLALGCGATARPGAPVGSADSERAADDPPDYLHEPDAAEGVFAMLEGDGGCVWIPPEKVRIMNAESEARARRDLVEHDRSCAKGEGFACSLAAYTLEEGNAGHKDARRAARFRKRAAQHWATACRGGNFDACAALADALVDGDGIRRDKARGEKLGQLANRGLLKGCEAGRGDDCHSLGTRYILGAGVKRDPGEPPTGGSWDTQQKYYAKAYALRKAACDAGAWDGCRSAAGQLAIGDGVPRDRDGGAALHKRAVVLALEKCAKKDVEACDYVRRTSP